MFGVNPHNYGCGSNFISTNVLSIERLQCRASSLRLRISCGPTNSNRRAWVLLCYLSSLRMPHDAHARSRMGGLITWSVIGLRCKVRRERLSTRPGCSRTYFSNLELEPSQGYASNCACFVVAEWPRCVADPIMYRNSSLYGGSLPWGLCGLGLASWGFWGLSGVSWCPLGPLRGLFGAYCVPPHSSRRCKKQIAKRFCTTIFLPKTSYFVLIQTFD